MPGKNHYSPLQQGPNGTFVFIHINKTAGSSIASALGLPQRHRTVCEVIQLIGADAWSDAYTFSVVRNPWDKVFSHFKYRVQRNLHDLATDKIDFNDWVHMTYGSEKHPLYYNNPRAFQPQVDWLSDPAGNIALDTIIRFENLTEDFARVAHHLGVDNILPHLKRSTTMGDYRQAYRPDAHDDVARWFEKDIAMFGYTFEGGH